MILSTNSAFRWSCTNPDLDVYFSSNSLAFLLCVWHPKFIVERFGICRTIPIRMKNKSIPHAFSQTLFSHKDMSPTATCWRLSYEQCISLNSRFTGIALQQTLATDWTKRSRLKVRRERGEPEDNEKNPTKTFILTVQLFNYLLNYPFNCAIA